MEIIKKLSLEEIPMVLSSYKAMGIEAFYMYNGTKLDSNMSPDDLQREIERLIVGISKEEYNIRSMRKKNIGIENIVSAIVAKKNCSSINTKFFINSVKKILPEELKNNWEFDCYFGLYNCLNDEIIKNIALLLINLYEKNDEKELLNVFRNTFMLINSNDDMLHVISFLKKYGTNQEFLQRCIYDNICEDDSKKDYEIFYSLFEKENDLLFKVAK